MELTLPFSGSRSGSLIMIRLDYNPADHSAVVTADPDCPPMAWAEVRRLCEERGQAVENTSANTVILPWWSLLVFRRDFGFALDSVQRQYGVAWEVAEGAAILLRQANARQEAYQHAGDALVITPDQIQSRLETVGWGTRQLKQYQLDNVSHLISVPAGATFSVPGAGKTTEALAAFALRRQPEHRLLIVAPKNAFAVWEEQIGECLPNARLTVARLDRGNANVRARLEENPHVMLVTYQTLPRAIGLIGRHLVNHPCFMFLDESHRMKRGLNGVSGAAVLSVCHIPAYKLILSGTPVPNAIDDLIPQFNFLYPEVRTTDTTVVGDFRPVFVRTRKSQLGLPTPRRVDVRVPMGPAQTRLYRTLTDHAVRRLAGLHVGDGQRFRAVARSVMYLIQAASDPSLLNGSEIAGHSVLVEALTEPPPKIMRACEISRRLAGEGKKTVIWSSFVNTVEHVAAMLQDLGAEYIHGGVDTSPDESVTDSREAKLKRFHDSNQCMVLVANPAACAEGISLHRVCHHAVYIDRTYNAAHYLQSEDRIHRLGLPPDAETDIVLLRTPNTVDDSVQRRLASKVATMQRILDDPDLNITPVDLTDDADPLGLTAEDLADLKRLLGVE